MKEPFRGKIRTIQRVLDRAVYFALPAFWILLCTVMLLGVVSVGSEWIWKRYFPKHYYERHHHQRVVHMERQPHDCEFWTPSIGNKNCHYERHDTVINSSGDVVITWERVDDWK